MVKKIGEKDKGNAYFSQRLFAFLIDILIVYFVASFISMPFLDTDKTKKLSDDALEIRDKFTSNEIDSNTFLSEYGTITYKIARASGVYSIATILIEILYYVVFQINFEGQTLGKKLMKIKVKSDEGDLFMNQMIFRSFLANFILLDIISFVFMLFIPKSIYMYVTSIFELIQYLIVIISIFMIIYSKDGRSIHDRLTHTRVVRLK